MIAANKCRDFLKSAARRIVAVEDEALILVGDDLADVEREVENRIGDENTYRLCDRLKEPYRTVAIAYYCLDKTVSQISSETGDNPKTIATRLYRARGMLKTMMKEDPQWSSTSTVT